jgi:hypothetical protein
LLPAFSDRSAGDNDRKRFRFEQWAEVVWIREVEVLQVIEPQFNKVGNTSGGQHRLACSFDRLFRDSDTEPAGPGWRYAHT